MRFKNRRPSQHRASAADRIVQYPSMARRPSASGSHAETQLMEAVREPSAEDFLTRGLPAVSPAAVLPPYPHTAFTPMSGHQAPARPLDVTQVLPVVRESVADATATQPMPRIPAQAALPPSAQHVDPRAWHDRTHVEDNDLELPTPGRHVLDGLMAMPDPAKELTAAPSRIIKALGGPEPEVKKPSLRVAVRLFRAARDMRRTREDHCNRDDARLNAVDARIKSFADRWAHDDAHWVRVAEVLAAKQEASDAGLLTKAYADDGTAAALYKVEELSHMIVQRARANAGVR